MPFQKSREAGAVCYRIQRAGMRNIMKIAIATKNWQTVSGHAGKARYWLLYDLQPGQVRAPLPQARIELTNDQILHYPR
jgi:hypothetical protein